MVTPNGFRRAWVSAGIALAAVANGYAEVVAEDVMRPFSAQEWQKPSNEVLMRSLSHEQYTVTQNEGTEMAFHNAYWDNKKAGIYVDIVSGEPLFSSRDKFVSGTGWPSFTRPISPGKIATRVDWSPGFELIEVRSRYAGSHLGHVFDDGPDAEGLRYCINSASLRFIPKQALVENGYAEFLELFGP
jgi:methionine-R-sulfoxide reductase